MSDSLDKLRSLRSVLESRIIGQREALDDITALLSRALCGCRYPGRPIASILFLGPTGVGKTETARIFTEHLFGEESKLVRLDMSEYMTLHSIDILRGSHQSERGLFGYYYDHSSGCGTLLFDEIEKAHPLIMDLFLQILSAARFTLATGETLDLSNYVVVAASNIGSRMLMESRSNEVESKLAIHAEKTSVILTPSPLKVALPQHRFIGLKTKHQPAKSRLEILTGQEFAASACLA